MSVTIDTTSHRKAFSIQRLMIHEIVIVFSIFLLNILCYYFTNEIMYYTFRGDFYSDIDTFRGDFANVRANNKCFLVINHTKDDLIFITYHRKSVGFNIS